MGSFPEHVLIPVIPVWNFYWCKFSNVNTPNLLTDTLATFSLDSNYLDSSRSNKCYFPLNLFRFKF